jgi:hypothetical protein
VSLDEKRLHLTHECVIWDHISELIRLLDDESTVRREDMLVRGYIVEEELSLFDE